MADILSTEPDQPLHPGKRQIFVRYQGLSQTVEVEGWFGEDEDDGVLALGDSRAVDRALNHLKAKAHDLTNAGDIRRIRKKLKLTQKQASALLGGGSNAFAKYEAADVLVSQAMSNLLRLMDRDPALLETLQPKDKAA